MGGLRKSLHDHNPVVVRGKPAGAYSEWFKLVVTPLLTPLQATFYPLGVPLRIVANHSSVIEAAREEWQHWTRILNVAPVSLRFDVSAEETDSLPPPVAFSPAHDLPRWTSDDKNHAWGDTNAGVVRALITPRVAQDSAWLLYHFLDPMALQTITALHLAPIHASCVALNGRGILLCGDSLAGKTSLAYACARRGFTYVSDDASYLIRNRAAERVVVGNPHWIRLRPDAPQFFPELADHPTAVRGNGKEMLRVATKSRPDLKTTAFAPIDRIVFLRRDSKSPAKISRLDPKIMRAWVDQFFYKWDREVIFAQREAFGTLLAGVRVQALEYSDLEAAVDVLSK